MGTDTGIKIVQFREMIHLLDDQPTRPNFCAPALMDELLEAFTDGPTPTTPVLATQSSGNKE